jgi:hypothetical protein
MPKVEGWKKGEGPYSKSGTPDDKLRRENKNTWDVKNISKVADEAHKVNDGFSGKLPKSE